jgi:hypothetical protein
MAKVPPSLFISPTFFQKSLEISRISLGDFRKFSRDFRNFSGDFPDFYGDFREKVREMEFYPEVFFIVSSSYDISLFGEWMMIVKNFEVKTRNRMLQLAFPAFCFIIPLHIFCQRKYSLRHQSLK